jgi:hypothetical protein
MAYAAVSAAARVGSKDTELLRLALRGDTKAEAPQQGDGKKIGAQKKGNKVRPR